MENRVNVIEVDITKVFPNKWNPNVQSDFMFQKELGSIKRNGFLVPLLVRQKDDAFEIIDGEHRWRAASELGMLKIPVNNLGQVSDAEASSLTVLLNEIRGKAESGLIADLMKDLENSLGKEVLIDIMPFTSVELDNMLNTADLNLGDLSPKSTPVQPAPDGSRTVSFTLPGDIADQLEEQVKRVKKLLFPEENPKDVLPAQAIQVICQTLAQLSDETLL